MYWLGPFQYASKRELLDRLKTFVATAATGKVTHPIAVQKLHLLIAQHPDAARKIGPGVDHFVIKRNALGAGQGLWLVRCDGSETSFSYKRCITGVRQSSYGKVCEALRFEVRAQLIAFRERQTLPTRCAISGNQIMQRRDLHIIDHKVPFWRLLQRFAEAQQLEHAQLQPSCKGKRSQGRPTAV